MSKRLQIIFLLALGLQGCESLDKTKCKPCEEKPAKSILNPWKYRANTGKVDRPGPRDSIGPKVHNPQKR